MGRSSSSSSSGSSSDSDGRDRRHRKDKKRKKEKHKKKKSKKEQKEKKRKRTRDDGDRYEIEPRRETTFFTKTSSGAHSRNRARLTISRVYSTGARRRSSPRRKSTSDSRGWHPREWAA